MRLTAPRDVQAAIQFSQIWIAAAIPLILLVSSQLKTAATRERNERPLIQILAAHVVVSLVGPAVSAAYVLALIVQLDQLWPCAPAEEQEERKLGWHGHVWSWTAMAVWNVLAIVELALAPHPSTPALVGSATVVALQCCLTASLPAVFIGCGRGRIRLVIDAEARPGGAASSESRPPPPVLRSSVADEIRTAGGFWHWARKFKIFKNWIWPADVPWVWPRIVAALVLLLGETGLSLYQPRVYGAFLDSVVRMYQGGPASKVWTSMATLAIVQFASSGTGLSSLRNLLWQKFKLRRERLARTRIFEQIMNYDAAFHDAADQTDVRRAAEAGAGVCEALDFLLLRVLPQLLTHVATTMAVLSLYGRHVALVQGYVVLLNMLTVLRESRTLLPLYDAQVRVRQEVEWRREAGLRYWSTAALHGQIDRETDAYSTGIAKLNGLQWQSRVLGIFFSLASDLTATLGRAAATALVIQQGRQAGGTIGLVVAFESYWGLLQGPLLFFMAIPKRVLKDFYKADRLRRLLEIKSNMAYGENELHLKDVQVEVSSVTFCYPGKVRPVFKGLNLVLLPGKITAVIGPSGVGKSTLMNLLVRLYDPDKNIRYGRPHATDAEVREAAERAGIHDDIMGMASQYDTMAGENGSVLSGGQRQRVALARVIYQGHSRVAFHGTTRLVIAHRLSSIRHADKIVVLQKAEDGSAQIAETGTHDELLGRGSVYTRYWAKYIGEAESKAAATAGSALIEML
ncbi:ABC transporter [Niveomyces insectorum RCEF 264]|uniref:ABC transporter n=1 Tax=Niveomyces insectorum RCEF 264 TaxID=1081102 RepID=A0A167NBA7_9HYPO|nr:ABC transporter [Niveomyces insectorum RCEF 264]